MDSITVNKANLIDTLRTNASEHRAIFIEAQEAYRKAMIDELDRALQEAKDGRPIRRAFALPVPEDHTEDFVTAIQMLEWDTADEVTLTWREFMQYVKNEWSWKQAFIANTQAYTVS